MLLCYLGCTLTNTTQVGLLFFAWRRVVCNDPECGPVQKEKWREGPGGVLAWQAWYQGSPRVKSREPVVVLLTGKG